MEITLSPSELEVAATVGVARHIQALRERRPDRHGAKPEDGWSLHIEGAAGELAAAKALGRYWDAPVGTFKSGGDVGAVQVRTRSRHSYELIVRRDDRREDSFVLVTGVSPHFRVHGWITGGEAMRPEWEQTHGGRPPAFFVPQNALRSLADLG